MNKSDFKKLIKEEIKKILNEESYDTLRDLKAAGVNPYNKTDVEKYLGRELDDAEYNEILGRRSGGKGKTIVGRRNGRPLYSDGTVGESKTKDLYENEETTTVEVGRATVVMKPGTEITPKIEQLIKSYDRNYRYIDDYTQMKDAEYENDKIMDQLKPLGIIRIY